MWRMLLSRKRIVRSVGVVAVVLGGLAANAEPAEACTTKDYQPWVTPAVDAHIPASVGGFWTFAQDGEVTLFDATGAEVAGTFEDPALLYAPGDRYTAGRPLIDAAPKVFKPNALLTPGNYVWKKRNDAVPGTITEVPFKVVESAPFPKKSGTLKVVGTKTNEVSGFGDDCSDSREVLEVRLAIDKDPLVTAYDAVVGWETKVDGQSWGVTVPSDIADRAPSLFDGFSIITVCSAPNEQSFMQTTSGRHHVEIRAVLPGGPDIEAAAIDVDVPACKDSGGSCSVSSRPSRGSLSRGSLAMVVTALLGLVAVSRRRPRRCRGAS